MDQLINYQQLFKIYLSTWSSTWFLTLVSSCFLRDAKSLRSGSKQYGRSDGLPCLSPDTANHFPQRQIQYFHLLLCVNVCDSIDSFVFLRKRFNRFALYLELLFHFENSLYRYHSAKNLETNILKVTKTRDASMKYCGTQNIFFIHRVIVHKSYCIWVSRDVLC